MNHNVRVSDDVEVRGVRVQEDCIVPAYPELGETPEFWGVYRREHGGPYGGLFMHVEDYPSRAEAVAAAARLAETIDRWNPYVQQWNQEVVR